MTKADVMAALQGTGAVATGQLQAAANVTTEGGCQDSGMGILVHALELFSIGNSVTCAG